MQLVRDLLVREVESAQIAVGQVAQRGMPRKRYPDSTPPLPSRTVASSIRIRVETAGAGLAQRRHRRGPLEIALQVAVRPQFESCSAIRVGSTP
jgi:hypothetical protein